MSYYSDLDLKKLAAVSCHGQPAIAFPVHHGGAGMIHDVNSNHILDIRGWGRIQYEKNGSQIQDAIADKVVEILNKEYASL